MGSKRPSPSTVIPPLLLGSAPFTRQYNADPLQLPTTALVERALHEGIRGFDTSPYYGPAEALLGEALASAAVRERFPRESYCIVTKVGRISGDEFDFGAAWVAQSVRRSCERLRTGCIDVVLCHDVEFARSPEQVVGAVRELRRLRDEEALLHYVGVSGYPLPVLLDLAVRVLHETGEPLDVVESYAHGTLQNSSLISSYHKRLRDEARVACVLNASLLGMGLLREQGPPLGAQGDWHPAPSGMREAVGRCAELCRLRGGEKLEEVALWWALAGWMTAGGEVGSERDALEEAKGQAKWVEGTPREKIPSKMGISVIGVSWMQELEETLGIIRAILQRQDVLQPANGKVTEWTPERIETIRALAKEVQSSLGEYLNSSWKSPPDGFKK